MKKNYLSMLFAMAMLFFTTGTNLLADNVLSIGNVTGESGATVPVSISLSNDDDVVGFQLDIMMPAEVAFVDGSVELTDRASTSHVLYADFVSSGALRILVYSMPATTLTGHSGDVCTFDVTLGDVAGDFPITMSNLVLSDINGQSLPVESNDGVITIVGEPANNILSLGEYSGEAGETITIGVNMTNEDVVSSLQFDIVFPESVSYVDGSAVLTDRKSPYHILVAQMIDETTLRVLTYAMPVGDFSGNDGEVVTMQITLGETEGTYPLLLEDVVLSDYLGTILPSSSENGEVTIGGGVPPVQTFTITGEVNPANAGTIAGAGEYEEGATATLTAAANAGYAFVDWTENGTQVSTEATYTFTVDSDRTLVANFEATSSDNYIIASHVTGDAGEVVEFAVAMNNSDAVAAFQMDIDLGTQLTYVDGSVALTERASENHTITAGIVDGILRVIAYSMPAADLEGNSGDIFTIQLMLGNEQGTYPVEVSNVILSSAAGTELPVAGVEAGSVTIEVPMAGNVLSVGDYAGQAGETMTIGVNMDNVDVVSGLQFDITFPAEVSYVDGSVALTDRASASHILVSQMIGDNTLRVLTYAMPSGDFTGNTGDVVTLQVTLGDVEGTYPLQLSEVVISDYLGTILPVSDVDGTITIGGGVPPTTYTVTATVNPAGAGTVAGAGEYEEGATATLTATANAGYAFENWTENGEVVSTEATYSFVVDADYNLVANFEEVVMEGNILSVANCQGQAGETITFGVNMDNEDVVSGLQFDITFPAEVSYVDGSVALTDRASAGHILVAQMISENTLRVLTYAMPSGDFSGNTGDVVTMQITLGDVEGTYPLTLSEAVLSDYLGTLLPVSTVDGTVTIGGGVPPTTYTVTATASPAEAGTIAGAGEYEEGATATLVATANVGYAFENWTENGEVVSTEATYSFVVEADRDLVANFIEVVMEGNILSINNYQGQSGETITVGVNMANEDVVSGIQFDVVLPESVSYVEGSAVLTDRKSPYHILVAQMVGENTLRVLTYAMPIGEFSGNNGDVVTFDLVLGSPDGTYPLDLTGSVLSDFMGVILPVSEVDGTVTIGGGVPPTYYNITATANPANAGTIAGAGEYAEGSTATLTATANAGYTFENWTEGGNVVSTDATYTFTVTADRALVANFAEHVADNNIVLPHLTGETGETLQVAVAMNNVDAVAGFQLDIPLNDQLTYVDGSVAMTDRASANHIISAGVIDGSLRIIAYSIPPTAISGNSGDLFTFELLLGEGQGTYMLDVENVILSDLEGGELPFAGSTVGSITIVGPLADNVLSVGNYTGQAGETMTIGVNMDNADVVSGLQFDITFPAEVSYVDGSVALTDRASAGHILVSQMISDNTLRVLTYAMPSGDFSGTTGDVITMQITLGNAEGTYPLQLSEVVISDYLGTLLPVSDIDGTITIGGGVPPTTYTIAATVNPANAGTVAGAGEYAEGSTATLTATANAGYVFSNWTENGEVVSSSAVYSFTVTANRSLVANFVEMTDNYLSVSTESGYAGEQVIFSVSLDNIDEVAGFQFDIELPEMVEYVEESVALTDRASANHNLAAIAIPGGVRVLVYSIPGTPISGNSGAIVTFAGILGDVPGTYPINIVDPILSDVSGNQLSVITGSGSAIINGAPGQMYVINATVNPANAGVVTGAGAYEEGATASLHATPNTGYAFVNWTEEGEVVSTSSMYSFTVLEDRNLVANFTEISGNVMTMSNEIGMTGDVKTFTISVDNIEEFVGFQTDILLPEGLEFIEGSAMLSNRATSNHYLYAQNLGDGVYRFLSYSMPGTPFAGNSGAVCTFQATITTEVPGTYPIVLSESYLSDMMGNILDLVTIDGSITVQGEAQQVAINAVANPADAGTISGTGMYDLGSTATLVASANSGYMFQNWTENGSVVSSNAIYTFTVLNARNLVANFTELSGNVMSIANTSGEAGETIELSLDVNNVEQFVAFQADITFPEGVTYVPSSIALTDRSSSSHILYAQSISSNVLRVLCYSMPGTYFTGNSGAVATMEVVLGELPGNYEVGLSEAAISDMMGNLLDLSTLNGIVTIESDLNVYHISAIVNPANSGTVMGTGEYVEGQTASLRATPNYGYDFVSWTEDGNVVSTSQLYNFVVTRDRNLVANFEASPTYVITATVNPANAGNVLGAGTYYYGEQVVMRATENVGYDFVSWEENNHVVSTNPTYTFFASADRDLIANFALETYTIALIADPVNGGQVSGAGVYNYGDIVTIEAVAHNGYSFIRWEENGEEVTTDATFIFEIEASHTYTAIFEVNTYTIEASASPANTGTVYGAGEYTHGSTVVMSAVPAEGYKFMNWTEDGEIVSTYSEYTFTATADRSLVANFESIEGIEDITAEDVALYPNPVVTNCVVEAPVEIISIVIINDNGQIVRTLQDVNSTKVTLDVNDLSTGNYFIQIAVPQGNIVKKLLKM